MQIITSGPVNVLSGQITVASDKSLSHRALILAAIAEGTTEISGFLSSSDCVTTLRALTQLGIKIQTDQETISVQGTGLYGLQAPQKDLDFSNSGTAIRLMAGLLCGQKFPTTLFGDNSLNQRPMQRIAKPLRQMGAQIQISKDHTPPIHIEPATSLQGLHYALEVASAQVKSCLLLAALYARGSTVLSGKIHTRDHTERMLMHFSYPLTVDNQQIALSGHGRLQAANLTIPGDLSSAAFFLVAGCLLPNTDIIIHNVGINPTRDGVIQILKQMGGDITLSNRRLFGTEPVADIQVKSSTLHGIEIPTVWVANAIDEFPILFIAAAAAQGTTRLSHAAELRVKESDRIQTMVDGLSACGIDAQAQDDGVVIQGGSIQGGEVDSDGDHRVAMSFLVAGAISKLGVKVNDCANIETSFPRFTETAKELGFNLSS